MRTPSTAAFLAAVLLSLPASARAQEEPGTDLGDEWAQADQAVTPPTEPPQDAPAQVAPPPADQQPNAPQPPQEEQQPAGSANVNGQWIYTAQYGWVWMPYGDAYAYVPPDTSGPPYAYVYYPTIGWTWLVAPWICGVGPWPYFGVYGPVRYGWYVHGWWRHPYDWPHHYPRYGGGYGGGWYRPRPAPGVAGPAGGWRGAPGARPAMPAWRGVPGRSGSFGMPHGGGFRAAPGRAAGRGGRR